MISIEEKLYITKEVNQIVISYAEKIVLSDLLLQYSFVDKNDSKRLTELIMDVYSFFPERPNRTWSLGLAKEANTDNTNFWIKKDFEIAQITIELN